MEGRYDSLLRMRKLGLRWLCRMPKVTQLGSNIADVLGAKVISHFPLSTFWATV